MEEERAGLAGGALGFVSPCVTVGAVIGLVGAGMVIVRGWCARCQGPNLKEKSLIPSLWLGCYCCFVVGGDVDFYDCQSSQLYCCHRDFYNELLIPFLVALVGCYSHLTVDGIIFWPLLLLVFVRRLRVISFIMDKEPFIQSASLYRAKS
jgi:hypothetical protein